MTKSRFGDVPGRYGDLLARFDVLDASALDRALHGILHLRPVAAQEALAIDRAFVLAVQPTIDELLHGSDSIALAVTMRPPARSSQEDLRTLRYQSHKSRTCFGV